MLVDNVDNIMPIWAKTWKLGCSSAEVSNHVDLYDAMYELRVLAVYQQDNFQHVIVSCQIPGCNDGTVVSSSILASCVASADSGPG